MKHTIFTLLIILTNIFTTDCQTLYLGDLIKISKCKEFHCFNNYVIKRGFSFNKNGTDEGGTWYAFSSDHKYPATSTPGIYASNTVVLEFNKDGSVSSSFRTSSKYQYKYIISQFKLREFKSVSTTNLENGVLTKYTSLKYPTIECNVQVENTGPSPTCTSYDIQITRKEPVTEAK